MKLLRLYQPLYAPADGDGAAGGDGTGSPAAFDPAAFSATILGAVNTAIAAQLKAFKTDFAKMTAAKPAAVAATADPDPVVDPAADSTTAAKPDRILQAQLKLMEKKFNEQAEQFAASNKASADREAAAELRERQTSIREALTGLPFGSDAQRDTAFKIFSGEVRRLEDGSLVGGAADLPLKEFIGEGMKQHQYLLAPKDVGGAGAKQGKTPAAGKSIDFDSIKPGMSPADAAAAAAQISAVLAQR